MKASKSSQSPWGGYSPWTWVMALTPALIFFVAAKVWLLPGAHRLREVEAERSALAGNIYESAWLDSTEAELREEVERLRAFREGLNQSWAPARNSQDLVDTLRSVAEAAGLAVNRTAVRLIRDTAMLASGYERVEVRLDGNSGYNALLGFFRTLHRVYPGLSIGECSIRRSGNELDFWLLVTGDIPQIAPTGMAHPPAAPDLPAAATLFDTPSPDAAQQPQSEGGDSAPRPAAPGTALSGAEPGPVPEGKLQKESAAGFPGGRP